MQLQTTEWNVRPLDIDCMHSSWFDDETRFPRGSIELDSALVMRGIPARWVVLDGAPQTEGQTCVR